MTDKQLIQAQLSCTPERDRVRLCLDGMGRGNPETYVLYAAELASTMQDGITRSIKFVEAHRGDKDETV